MANKKISELAANPDTTLTAVAVGDYILVYDISEPLDVNKIKAITTANFLKLVTETARQALVTGQAAGDLIVGTSATALGRIAKGTTNKILNAGASAPQYSTLAQLIALQALVSGQAAGDLFYAASATAIARKAKGTDGSILTEASSVPTWLPKGTSGQVLKMNAGATAPEWAINSGVGCQVYRSANQSIPNGITTPILFDSEYFDDNNFHSVSSNTDRITVPVGYNGRYLINFTCHFASAPYGGRAAWISVNDVYIAGSNEIIDGGVAGVSLNVSVMRQLSDGDYIKASVDHDVGSDVNIDVSIFVPSLSAVKL